MKRTYYLFTNYRLPSFNNIDALWENNRLGCKIVNKKNDIQEKILKCGVNNGTTMINSLFYDFAAFLVYYIVCNENRAFIFTFFFRQLFSKFS